MNDLERIRLTLRNKELFQQIPEKDLDIWTEQSTFQTVDKGQVLFVQGEKAVRFFVITFGWIKLFRETLDGTQAIVDILSSGHMFGESSLFHEDMYPYSAEAAENVEILSLPLTLLKTQLETNPKFSLALLSEMAHMRRQQDRELEHRAIQNAPQRIACFLLRLVNQSHTGSATIHLPYDKTLIAARLGMQPETFSRALAKLKETMGIEIRGSSVVLKDIHALSCYSCTACTSEFPCKDLKNSC